MSFISDPNKLIQLYLSVDTFKSANLEKIHLAQFGSIDIVHSARRLFERRLHELATEPNARPFLVDWALTILGAIVVGLHIPGDTHDRLIRGLFDLFFIPQRGFLSASRTYLGAHQHDLESEVYATFYGMLAACGLRASPGLDDLVGMRTWVAAQEHEGGYYNSSFSGTAEEYRKQAELTFQSLCALKLLRLLDELTASGTWAPSTRLARRYLSQLPAFVALSPKYHAAFYVLLCDPALFCQPELLTITDYLRTRQTDAGGCVDYYPKEKFDEASRHTPRYARDQEVPHIYATFYALHLARLMERHCSVAPSIRYPDALGYLSHRQPDSDGAFGEPLLIKEYPAVFGVAGTLKETLLLTVAPYLI